MAENDVTSERMGETGGAGVEPAGNRFGKAHHILMYFIGGVAGVWLLSGFYQVNADQVAIVERLGQYVTGADGRAEQVEHGLHYHLPWPIDRVHVIAVRQQFTLTVKAFNASPAEYDDFKREYLKNPDNPFAGMRPEMAAMAVNAIFNPYLISSDKNVLHMEVSVAFRVSNPEQWLTSVSHDYHETYDPAARDDMRNELLQQIAQRALLVEAARMSFQETLLTKRQTLPQSLQGLMQNGMKLEGVDARDLAKREEIELGIEVVRVEVPVVRPPDAIKGAYDNVVNQLLNRDTTKTNAESDANTMLTKASGEKSTLRTDALSYQQTTIQGARGEADRFKEVLTQFRNAPDVTRWNLYVEAAGAVTGNAKRIFFAQPGQRTWIELDPPTFDANQARPGGN